MTQHSAIAGGSTIDLTLNCHGRLQLMLSLPEIIEAPSAAAEEGSFYHAIMETLLTAYLNEEVPSPAEFSAVVSELIGEHVYDRIVTIEHVTGLIAAAYRALMEAVEFYGGGFKVVSTELSVKFPNIPSAFGTTDLLLMSQNYVLMLDYKFGAAQVFAVYKESDGDRLNPQLLFYMGGARAAKKFGKRKLVIGVIQPQCEPVLTHAEITNREVDDFIEDVENAIAASLERNPPLTRGRWCTYCRAKPACPKWTAPIRELAKIAGVVLDPNTMKTAASYATMLSTAKTLAGSLTAFAKEVDEQILGMLKAGEDVPGWVLTPKIKLRKWIAPEVVEPALKRIGFKKDDIWRTELVTFGAAEKTAKRLGKTIPDNLRIAPPSTEYDIVRADAAVSVEFPSALEMFEASLAENAAKQRGKS
jgi:hypothetical protein